MNRRRRAPHTFGDNVTLASAARRVSPNTAAISPTRERWLLNHLVELAIGIVTLTLLIGGVWMTWVVFSAQSFWPGS